MNKNNATIEKLAYTVMEVAQMLEVGRNTAYDLIHRSDFPAVRITENHYIVPVDMFNHWVDKQSQSSEREPVTSSAKPFISVSELMQALGIGRNNAYALVKRKGFPAITINESRIVIPFEKLRVWLNAQCDLE